jgi:hypothetical protein
MDMQWSSGWAGVNSALNWGVHSLLSSHDVAAFNRSESQNSGPVEANGSLECAPDGAIPRCEERSDEAIQFFWGSAVLDCVAEPVSGWRFCADPLARNDGFKPLTSSVASSVILGG